MKGVMFNICGGFKNFSSSNTRLRMRQENPGSFRDTWRQERFPMELPTVAVGKSGATFNCNGYGEVRRKCLSFARMKSEPTGKVIRFLESWEENRKVKIPENSLSNTVLIPFTTRRKDTWFPSADEYSTWVSAKTKVMQNTGPGLKTETAYPLSHSIPSWILQAKCQSPGQILGPIALHVLIRKMVAISSKSK